MNDNASTSSNEYKPIYTKQKEWQNTGTPDGEIKIFHPTMEEFADFSQYIQNIERQNAHLSSGICKVIPPNGWHPRPSKFPHDYSDIDEKIIECPVKERIECVAAGCYVKNNTVYRKQMYVKDFRRMALSKQYRTPHKDEDLIDMERHFWRNLLHHEPIYGADSPGTIYDENVKEFNMNRLGTVLDLLKEIDLTIKGVNTVFLYFGMWKTMFPWHAEDMDLYSINYLHFGEPKFWYAIPPEAAEKFERLAAQRFPDGLNICKAFLRHKLYIVSPTVLKSHGIPYGTMVQYPGEFIITFPKGYHMGFNIGYNCAESTNFALERWIDYGKNCVLCYCRKDTVEIDMRPFMKKYRPEEYKEWFDYWYGERPSSYKSKTSKRMMKTSSQDTTSTSSPSETNSEESFPSPPAESICTKRQKKIFQARKPMHDLWANRPINLYAEKQHNQRCGRLYPHCCVCQYFIAREIWIAGKPAEELPEKSRRYVSDQMFEKCQKIEGTVEEDELLTCSNCLMVVHKKCYPLEGTNAALITEADNGIQQQKEPSIATATQNKQNWLCERCFGRNDTLIRSTSCRMCELRAGALQKTWRNNAEGNDFMHVICALMNRQTRFMLPRDRRAPFSPPPRKLVPPYRSTPDHDEIEPAQRSPNRPAEQAWLNNSIDSSSTFNTSADESTINSSFSTFTPQNFTTTHYDEFSMARQERSTSETTTSQHAATEYPASYQCEVCGQQAEAESLIRCDTCVSLGDVGAMLHFHVTCAPLADITFERRDFPECLVPVCSFHSTDQGSIEEEEEEALLDTRHFQINQKVIVYEENEEAGEGKRLLSWGRIENITEHLFATVDFVDGTSSGNLFPCHIKKCECKLFGCTGGNHIPGSLVYVEWNDDKLYEGYYRGKTPRKKFTVKLTLPWSQPPDDDIVEVDRQSIYRQDDPNLPEVVRRNLLKRRSTESLAFY